MKHETILLHYMEVNHAVFGSEFTQMKLLPNIFGTFTFSMFFLF
jgi:hypothetical protein